jgi:uncharacterized membrane protein
MPMFRVLLLAMLLVATTLFWGWISVPCVAAVYALLRRDRAAAGEAAVAALLAWGALLARVAVHPAFTTLLARLTVLFKAPGFVVAIVTLLFAVALSWSAARVVSAVVVRRVA